MSFSTNSKARLVREVSEVGAAAGEQVVDDNHAPAFGEQSVAEMGSQETGAAGDQSALWAHAFLAAFLTAAAGTPSGMRGRASHAVISEAVGRHDFGIVQVAAVDHDGILEFLAEGGRDRGWRTLPTR